MNRNEFDIVVEKAKKMQYSALTYTEFEDVEQFDIIKQEDDLIIIFGYDAEAKYYQYVWAANEVNKLIEQLTCKEPYYIPFIPKEWVKDLEAFGLKIRNQWHDFTKFNLDDINCEEFLDSDLMKDTECEAASNVTLQCRWQSRGFTGQTTEWMKNWISSENNFAKNVAVVVSRNSEGVINGVVCTGTYAHDSEKGPIAWIREVAVSPAYQNQGVARKTITKALAYCKKHGATRAHLAADEDNKGAIHLYESLGFIPSEEDGEINMIKC